jgi:cytosine/adenosine deaminase-related metal-dependent hydrolase
LKIPILWSNGVSKSVKSLIVKGKYVLTLDRKYRTIQQGAVFVEGDKILDVGPAKKIESSYSADEVIDAKECVVMPGLICSHSHMYGVLSHGIPVSQTASTFIAFLKKFWWPRIENALDKEQISAAASMSSIQMVKTGTTCCADVLEAPNSIPGALEVEAQATEMVGLRSVLSFEGTERISEENGWKGAEENLNFIKKHNRKNDSLTKGMFCTHTTFTCSPQFLRKVRDLANEYPAGIHIHLEEGAYESKYCLSKYRKLPVELYEKIGFLGSDVLASQCVHTLPKEIKLLRKHDVKISHMPLSNCEVGGGIAPVPSFLQAGLTVGLGTDGYIQDMFEVMRAAFLIHKGNLQDASVMPAQAVIRMATVDAAKAIRMENLVGSITPKKQADIITVDLESPTPVTPENLIPQLVVFGEGNMVQDVLINGKKIMRNRKILIMNEDRARAKCREAAESLWNI